jgi:hypothetical protein
MYNPSTILNQLQQILPMNEFQQFVGQHQADKYSKKLKCKNQLSILLYAQATEKDSLRDIETSLLVEHKKWYHLGLKTVARNTLSNANKKRPAQVYESLFYKLLEKCKGFSFESKNQFSFRNDLQAIDASTVDLCLSIFPWAKFRTAKGAIKLHTTFNIRSQIPEVVIITDGKCADITAAREIDLTQFPKGTIFVFDRGYNDYSFLRKIKDAGHHFVIRVKKNAHFIHLGQHRKISAKGVLCDEKVVFALDNAEEKYPYDLRLVTYYDEENDKIYQFLTDEFRLSASNIALIYKKRWDIELFFKWIKQHLKIKTFLGTSENAVMTQIWIAMIYYLLLAWIKFQTKFKGSLLDLMRIIQTALLQPISLINLLNLTPKTVSEVTSRGSPNQISLF